MCAANAHEASAAGSNARATDVVVIERLAALGARPKRRAFLKEQSEPGGIYARYDPSSPSFDPETARHTTPLTTGQIQNRIHYLIPLPEGTVLSPEQMQQI